MLADDIRRLATALDVDDIDRMSPGELIRAIQFQEGHMPCFCEAWSAPCGIGDCPFASACSSHLRIRAMTTH
jgi:hypothetical protein